jgi:hypothetical protein
MGQSLQLEWVSDSLQIAGVTQGVFWRQEEAKCGVDLNWLNLSHAATCSKAL